MCVSQNCLNLKKHSPFPQFSSKLAEIFIGEIFDQSGSFFTKLELWRAHFFDYIKFQTFSTHDLMGQTYVLA